MNTGMSNARRRLLALANLPKYRDGGPVRGPGTGTSDEVLDEVRPGSYIVPADSTRKVGQRTLADVAKNLMPEADDGSRVPVRLSNGEYKLSPEQVHAIGVRTLDQMKDATHKPAGPAPRLSAKERLLRLADGGMVNDVMREGNSYSGGNVGGSITVNGTAPGGTFSSVSSTTPPAAPSPATAMAPTAPQPVNLTSTATVGLTGSAGQASSASTGWAARNAQQNADTAASTIMNRGWGAAPTGQLPSPAGAGAPASAPRAMSVEELEQAGMLGQRKKTNIDLGSSSPSLGMRSFGSQRPGYADGGAVLDDDQRQQLISQIPTGGQQAPAADGSQDRWSNTETGRNLSNMAAALPGSVGNAVPAVARTGGVISMGIDKAARALGGLSAGGGLGAAAAPAAAAPASGAGAGRGSVNPPMVNPNAEPPAQPSASQQVYQATAPSAGDATSYAPARPSVRERLLAIGDDMPMPAQPTPVIAHSGNDWASRKALENARAGASSIMNTVQWGGRDGPERESAQTYRAMLANDIAKQQAQPAIEQEAMRQRGLAVRERLLQIGENARANLNAQRYDDANQIAAGELGLKQAAAGFQNRAAQRMENAQVAYEQAGTPALRAAARDRLLALAGKAHEDQWKAVALQGGTDAMGNKTESILGAVNERTGEMRRMPTGQAGADRVTTKAQFDALPKGATYTGEDGRTYRKP